MPVRICNYVELIIYTFSIISKASVHKLCLIVAS